MPGKSSFVKTFAALENVLRITRRRQNLISSNLSNVDTPNYRAKDIDFKTVMDRALKSDHEIKLARTHARHIGFELDSPDGIEAIEERGEWNGFNWVNIDTEMVKLIENNLRYKTATEALLRKINIIKEVIREGGR